MTDRVAIYGRVSTDDQARNGTSLPDQVERCHTLASQRGWTVVGEWIDDGYSGATGDRPALKRLLECARRGEFARVVVTAMDRLARDLRIHLNLEHDLRGLGVEVTSCEGPDMSGLERNFRGVFAEEERSKIRERTTQGLRATARNGHWTGGPAPFGWHVRRPEGAAHSHLELDASESATLLRAIELIVDQRLTTWQAAAVLNEENRPPRKAVTWDHANLRFTLQRSCLSGVWTYRPKQAYEPVVTTAIPALIDETRHRQLSSVLAATSTGPRRRTKPDRPRYLLTGRLVSPHGVGMHGLTRADSGATVYRCAHAKAELGLNRCDCRTVQASIVEDQLWSQITAILTDTDRLMQLAGVAETAASSTEPVDDLAKLDRQIARIERDGGRTIADLVKRGMHVGVIDSTVVQLETDLVRLRGRREQVATWMTLNRNRTERIQRVWALSQTMRETLSDPGIETQRAVIELLEVRVQVVGWHQCANCAGKGGLSGGEAPSGWRGRGTVMSCPTCLRHRVVPDIVIDLSVPLGPVLESPERIPLRLAQAS